jgi:hypothetical protein
MMLGLRGSPCLPNHRIHGRIHKTKELGFICRERGILAVLCEVPSDRVLHLLMELNITKEDPKLDKLSNVIPSEGSNSINVPHPSALGHSLRDHALFALGGFKNEGGDVNGRPTLDPRSMPKWSFGPVSHRDGGCRIENVQVLLPARVPRTNPILSGHVHSSHGQRNLRAIANLSIFCTPRPPYFLGRHTTSQLTLQLAPVVESLAAQRKALSNLLMNFEVPGGMESGARW